MVDAFDVIVSGVTVGVIVSGVTVDVDDDLGISDDIVEDDAGTVVIGVSDTVAVNVVDVIVVVGGGELQSCIFPQIGFSVVNGVVVGVSGCLVVVVVVVDVIVVVVSGVAIGQQFSYALSTLPCPIRLQRYWQRAFLLQQPY